ncbi:hypothetical protein MES5069_770037 [Mesorhizobium escarrei]|uniref:Uncharacterized protein n=1 Tax=Mesorhizobium escarrei TaxID=666018 RepID=A0ABM9EIH3_9HYPH|nr:hypothetical protein MES5069_770037 [Mesorhizobium escarrei]
MPGDERVNGLYQPAPIDEAEVLAKAIYRHGREGDAALISSLTRCRSHSYRSKPNE